MLFGKRLTPEKVKPEVVAEPVPFQGRTLTLFKAITATNTSSRASPGKQVINEQKFPLYNDEQVGFRSSNSHSYSACLTEVERDDDVDTDEEVYDTALKACSRDFNDTRRKMEQF